MSYFLDLYWVCNTETAKTESFITTLYKKEIECNLSSCTPYKLLVFYGGLRTNKEHH